MSARDHKPQVKGAARIRAQRLDAARSRASKIISLLDLGVTPAEAIQMTRGAALTPMAIRTAGMLTNMHLSLCVVVLPRGLPSTPTGRGHHERRGTLDARDSRQALDGQEGEWARLTLLLPCQSSFPSAAPRLMNSVALGSNA